jgi:hypothetical protein
LALKGYFVFKRGMKGVYQHCAEKHLHRYLAEFDFHYNHRVGLGYTDIDRTKPQSRAWKASVSYIDLLTSPVFKFQAARFLGGGNVLSGSLSFLFRLRCAGTPFGVLLLSGFGSVFTAARNASKKRRCASDSPYSSDGLFPISGARLETWRQSKLLLKRQTYAHAITASASNLVRHQTSRPRKQHLPTPLQDSTTCQMPLSFTPMAQSDDLILSGTAFIAQQQSMRPEQKGDWEKSISLPMDWGARSSCPRQVA